VIPGVPEEFDMPAAAVKDDVDDMKSRGLVQGSQSNLLAVAERLDDSRS
jgi:hypothetical protein